MSGGGTAYEESSANSDQASIATLGEALTFTETGGLLPTEAENYTTTTSQGGKSWTPCASASGICATCGNGTCETGETCSSCSSDCLT